MGCPTVDRTCVIGRCKQAEFKNASFFTLLASQPVSCRDMDDEARIKRHIGFATIRNEVKIQHEKGREEKI